MSRNLKRSGPNEQDQPRFKKRDQTQDGPSAPKAKLEKEGGSQDVERTCATCGKKHYDKCIAGNSDCFGC